MFACVRACVRVAPVAQAYDEDRNVLEGISLMIPEGAKVGVLGRSGCGKSTLLKLMARVYQPRQGGSVRYFGQPLNEVMLDEVASFMQQQNVLFDDTVSTFKPPSEQSPQTFPCSHIYMMNCRVSTVAHSLSLVVCVIPSFVQTPTSHWACSRTTCARALHATPTP